MSDGDLRPLTLDLPAPKLKPGAAGPKPNAPKLTGAAAANPDAQTRGETHES